MSNEKLAMEGALVYLTRGCAVIIVYMMNEIIFVWDENKNQKNIKDHKISFEEAKTVFYDPHARIIYDPDHSKDEDRFIILGLSRLLNLLIVCHCYKGRRWDNKNIFCQTGGKK
jgi:uncharacterized DUF497 family protein